MYATSTASTTSGSGRVASEALNDRRVRVVRLLRPKRAAPAFGFSLRGGKEYGAGFFISKVEFNSEAYLQGLKVGDQLVNVNGYRVDDAVHSELVHYLTSQYRLKIKVRHVGMLPVKEKVHDAMSWQFVSERASLCSEVSSSPTLCHDTERMIDLRLSILVPPNAKLGCGICKGPEWKPGIFVQFVREGGIAREAGLRPGDQIMSCNGLDFTNATFNEAISAMKATGRIELIIREGAGTELVSPESSGYNSSASSAAGERSPAAVNPHVPLPPPAALRRRLASVAEEAADRADRLTMGKLKRRTWDSLDFDWKTSDIHNFDAPSDIEPDYDSPSIPNNPHTFENKNNMRNNNNKTNTIIKNNTKNKNALKREFVTGPSNRTIINLTEDGATIQCSYDNQNSRNNNTLTANNRSNDKTIVVEVHHTTSPPAACKPPLVPPPMQEPSDTSSIGSSATLSNAIAEEFQKRLLKKKNSCPENSIPTNTIKKQLKPVETDKKKTVHDALIDEFKKVHRKMFLNQDAENNANAESEETDSFDRQQTLPLRRVDTEINGAANNSSNDIATNHSNGAVKNLPNGTVKNLPNGTIKNFSNGGTIKNLSNGGTIKNLSHGTVTNLSNGVMTKSLSNGVIKSLQNGTQNDTTPSPKRPNPPPPPPPMPISNGNADHHNDNCKVAEKSSQIVNPPTDLKAPNYRKNGISRTPTPDYNNKLDTLIRKVKEDKAELDSLESYKLKNPLSASPKPPSNYFMRAPNGTATMKKNTRPVSVTIGEYAYNGTRREPTKLEFLNGDNPDGPLETNEETSISNRLQSELVLTLSRSNLRKKTDAMERRVVDQTSKVLVTFSGESDSSMDQNFHARYGNNLLPLPPSVNIPKVTKTLNKITAN